jgi:hypothetical protein
MRRVRVIKERLYSEERVRKSMRNLKEVTG